jgi:hypothetical protein
MSGEPGHGKRRDKRARDPARGRFVNRPVAGGGCLGEADPMKNTLLVVGIAMVVGAQAGCGSDGSASCANVQPCGGSVAGTWRIVNTCIDQSALNMSVQMFCPQANVSETAQESGTITFNADMTYTETVSGNATLVENIPASCFPATATCAGLNNPGQQPPPQQGTTTSVSCTGTAVCTCRITAAITNVTMTGTYATSGTMLTVTPAGSTAQSDGYCVQGNTLHVTSTAMGMSTGATGQTSTTSTSTQIVLERQ